MNIECTYQMLHFTGIRPYVCMCACACVGVCISMDECMHVVKNTPNNVNIYRKIKFNS